MGWHSSAPEPPPTKSTGQTAKQPNSQQFPLILAGDDRAIHYNKPVP